jgi:hypothetical protein
MRHLLYARTSGQCDRNTGVLRWVASIHSVERPVGSSQRAPGKYDQYVCCNPGQQARCQQSRSENRENIPDFVDITPDRGGMPATFLSDYVGVRTSLFQIRLDCSSLSKAIPGPAATAAPGLARSMPRQNTYVADRSLRTYSLELVCLTPNSQPQFVESEVGSWRRELGTLP